MKSCYEKMRTAFEELLTGHERDVEEPEGAFPPRAQLEGLWACPTWLLAQSGNATPDNLIVDHFERRAENVAEFACYDILVFLGDDGNMRCLVSCKEFPGVGAMPPLCTIILLALTGIT